MNRTLASLAAAALAVLTLAAPLGAAAAASSANVAAAFGNTVVSIDPDGRTFAVAVMVRQTRQGPQARHKLMQSVARATEAYWRDSATPANGQQQASNEAAGQAGF